MIKVMHVKEIMSSFEDLFFNRPGMLGSSVEINGMFYFYDQLRVRGVYDIQMDFSLYSWQAFLVKKKLIVEGHDKLFDELIKNPSEYDLLQELRLEYYEWLDEQLK